MFVSISTLLSNCIFLNVKEAEVISKRIYLKFELFHENSIARLSKLILCSVSYLKHNINSDSSNNFLKFGLCSLCLFLNTFHF